MSICPTALPNAPLTRHARQRQQQRSIPQVIIDFLMLYGESRPAFGGAERVYFTKRSWKRLEAYLGAASAAFDRYRNVYLITAADGGIVTVAYER